MKYLLFPKGVPVSKRVFDLVATLIAAIILSPMLLMVALAVWLKHGWPILFRQVRPGYRGKLFTIFKFRTMSEKRDGKGNLLPDRIRLTSLGKFLRATSLDEFPEMINILRGEMSWVGPRPLLTEYIDRYTPDQARRHDVLPGITGWAQVNGRNILTWEDKFQLDVWYVDNWSFWLDIKILLFTAGKVLQREGISQPGHATAEKFTGSPYVPSNVPEKNDQDVEKDL